MRRPVPYLDRYSMRICLRGEINPTYEKKVPCASGITLKWLQHRQDHDTDHQDRRHLIDNSIKFCGMLVMIIGKIAHPAHHETVHGREHEDEKDLRMQPARTEPAALPAEPE